MKLIDYDSYKMLDFFRKLRNRAAHEVVFQFDSSDKAFFKKFFNLKNDLEIELPIDVKPIRLYGICYRLIAILWLQNISILHPIFFPPSNP